MRTETLAIVFTDIKGFTAATSSQTHKENAVMLRRIERLVAPVVRAYNGRVVKSIGDAYMIVFRSPTEAVRCATAVQDRLYQHNLASSTEHGIHIRIAMNIGEVRVDRGDVFGEPVNIASRIESITPADEIYFSEATYLTMNRSEVAAERIGEYDLKGIPEPVTVYRVKRFNHVQEAEDGGEQQQEQQQPNNLAEASTTAAKNPELPFGGAQLGHWHKMRWLRRAYIAMWVLAVLGLAGAAYLRYRPGTDYSRVVTAVKTAVENDAAMQALAKAGEIPQNATQERQQVRRYRRQAVRMLIQNGDLETARSELRSLLAKNDRDAEALVLKALLLDKKGKARPAVDTLAKALRISESLASRPEVIDVIVRSYAEPKARRYADRLVNRFIKQAAVDPLLQALADGVGGRVAHHTMAARLDKLGAGEHVDWVALSIEDLQANSCRTRRKAIRELINAGDERAIGPLMKLGESRSCGARLAKEAAKRILGK